MNKSSKFLKICLPVCLRMYLFKKINLFIKGRWKKADLKKLVTFKTVVRSVTFDDENEKFTVTVENLAEKRVMPSQEFDFVFVAGGHYSVPFVPHYPGIERFPGRVMHSHDFRDACEFKGKRLLVVSFVLFFFSIAKCQS